MKQLYLLVFCSILFLLPAGANAQSFTVAHDTVTITAGPTSSPYIDSVINLTTGNINIQWKVVATNFPADWMSPCSGICDPSNCYLTSSLWPSAAAQSFTSVPGEDVFDLSLDLSCTTTSGCYYITVRMNNAAISTDTATETFIICKPYPANVPVTNIRNEISLYPNPATSELNVTYDASADIKTIAVYDIIGKVMTVYKVTGNTGANLNLENISSGIYFVRLMNSHGGVVTTRKFTKQ